MNLISAQTVKKRLMISVWNQMHKDQVFTFRDHLELKRKLKKAAVKS